MKTILIVAFIFLGFKGISQELHPSQMSDTMNIYYISLRNHLEHLKGYYKKGLQKEEYSIFVQEDATTKNLPLKIDDFSIQYLTDKDILVKTKKAQYTSLIVIQPVEIIKGFLKVNINDYKVSSPQKTQINYSIGGGGSYIYKYSCNEGYFVLADKKYHGI